MSTFDLHKPEAERMLSRPLAPHERLLALGHPASHYDILGLTLTKHSAGNAWAVPCLASVLLPMLQEIALSGIGMDGHIKPLSKEALGKLTSDAIVEELQKSLAMRNSS